MSRKFFTWAHTPHRFSFKRARPLALLCLCLLGDKAHANFAEMFAASAGSAALAGQGDMARSNQAANNYYAPALLARANNIQFSLSSFWLNHNFEAIDNVLIRNDLNSQRDEYGPMTTNYGNLYYNALHLALPIMRPGGAVLGLSFFSPLSTLLAPKTGDPFITDYVMYQARNHRSMGMVNLAGRFSGRPLLWSLGLYTGIGVSSRVFSKISFEGETGPASYGRVAVKTTPQLAALASLAWEREGSTWALTLQQQMKSPMAFRAEVRVNDPHIPTDMEMESLSYYDPALLRLAYHRNWGRWGLHSGLEYQWWKNYRTPVLEVRNNPNGNIRPSANFESLPLRNLLIPKLALSFYGGAAHTSSLGLSYRPSPLTGDFSGPGNSVDNDRTTIAVGHRWQTSLWGKAVGLDFALQFHQLDSRRVVKTFGREDGSAGQKIGSPGYSIGGQLLAGSFGLSLDF